MIRTFVTLALLSLFSSPAFADDTTAPHETVYDFDPDSVQGVYLSPSGEVLRMRRGNRTRSLIEIRAHFVSELLKSIEDI